MANITLTGILLDSLGEVDVGAIVTFTHETTTGQTIATTKSDLIVAPNGAYSITLEYGEIRIDYTTRYTERFVGTVIVNGDTTATNLPELLNAAVPVTPAVILQMQGILSDAEAAADTSEAFADQMTTFDLIGSAAVFASDTNITTKGYLISGDGGSGSWVKNGVTGQTVSQSPAQLGDGLLNDASGNQWSVVTDGTINVKTLGAVGDNSNDDTAAIQASYNYAKNNAQDLFIAGGIYKCTSTLIFDGAGVNTRGAGSAGITQTVIIAEHNSGAGIHVSADRQTIGYLRMKGGVTRSAATNNIADCGILIEPPDTAGNLMSQVGIDWVLVDAHNGSGIVANQITGLTMEQTVIYNCRRHGFVFGNSDESTRTNKDNYSGQVYASECRFTGDNYSLLVGAPEGVNQGGSAYRIHMRSIDVAGGPGLYDPAISTYGPAGWWIRGQNIEIENSAFSPGDSGGECLIISGKNVQMGKTNRLLGLATSDYAIRVLNWTVNQSRDITIDRPMVEGAKPLTSLVTLDKSAVAPAQAVEANTVSVISSQPMNGPTLDVVDRYIVSKYTDRQKERINSELAIKILSIPTDNLFISPVSGVLDVSRSNVQVTGEGGVSDSIDTINFDGGAPDDGMELTITSGTGTQVITINNATGNILCGANRVLDSSADCAVLVYKSGLSNWLLKSFQSN